MSHHKGRMSHHRHHASTARLAQLAAGVLVFHVMNSVLQEAVFQLEGFHHSLFLSFLQTACIALLALFDFIRTGEARKAPLKTYFFLSLFSTVSVILTNEASHLLNYPTQVIFKSSKLLFVMTMRFLIIGDGAAGAKRKKHHGSSHKRAEILACLLIVLGLVAFTYATSASKMKSGTPTETTIVVMGIAAICVAMICDALLYIGEEKYCFSACQASNTEVILFCYAFATINSGTSLLASGQLMDSIDFAKLHPSFIAFVVAFSLCNFCGTNFLLKVVAEFNSNSAVIVTSVRKMFTVMCSYLIYPKPFGILHFCGLAMVTVGIFLHEKSRHQAKKEEVAHQVVQEEDGIV